MPIINMFGEEEFTKEELTAQKKAQAETEKQAKTKNKNQSEEDVSPNQKISKKYKYPFLLYVGHDYKDVSHIFTEGKEYSAEEITAAMIAHGCKEFKVAPSVEYEYFADENCLFPKFKLGNRG